MMDTGRVVPVIEGDRARGPWVELWVDCIGSITLEVVFGSPDNFRSEELIFGIVPFRSGYHALLGRTAFARFNANTSSSKCQDLEGL